uniref:Uncharacterized protein n=1 Tax=Anguilla anguilla TaxID=7936 RepID=A0A0E9PXX0_ANGAN
MMLPLEYPFIHLYDLHEMRKYSYPV